LQLDRAGQQSTAIDGRLTSVKVVAHCFIVWQQLWLIPNATIQRSKLHGAHSAPNHAQHSLCAAGC